MARKNTSDVGRGGNGARQMNAGKSIDVVNAVVAGKPNMGGKSGSVKTIGPMSATTFLGKGKSLDRGHVGPAGAPYHDKAR